jgi:hypothetical protein
MTQDCAILNRHADVVCRRWDIVRLCVLLSHCVSAGRRVNNVVVDDLCFRPHCIPRHLENRRVFDRDAGGEKTRKHVGAALRSRRFKAKMTRNASCELRPRSLGYSSREISHGLQLTLRGLFVQFGIAPMPSTITCRKHKNRKKRRHKRMESWIGCVPDLVLHCHCNSDLPVPRRKPPFPAPNTTVPTKSGWVQA